MASDPEIILVPDERYEQWVRGFEILAAEGVGDAQVREWTAAVEVFYVNTQRFAHVLSGDMKRSGRTDVRKDGAVRIVGSVRYGGTTGLGGKVDYVGYELRRGGSHDFFARGMSATHKTLQRAVGKAAFERLKELMA